MSFELRDYLRHILVETDYVDTGPVDGGFSAGGWAFPLYCLWEQLGLRLESQRGLVDVLIVESVERPAPD